MQQPQLTEQLALPSSQLPAIAAPSLSAVLVTIKPGADLDKVQSLIQGWPDVSVYTRDGQEELLVQGLVDKARKQLTDAGCCAYFGPRDLATIPTDQFTT